jgi:hypothetical protein
LRIAREHAGIAVQVYRVPTLDHNVALLEGVVEGQGVHGHPFALDEEADGLPVVFNAGGEHSVGHHADAVAVRRQLFAGELFEDEGAGGAGGHREPAVVVGVLHFGQAGHGLGQQPLGLGRVEHYNGLLDL